MIVLSVLISKGHFTVIIPRTSVGNTFTNAYFVNAKLLTMVDIAADKL